MALEKDIVRAATFHAMLGPMEFHWAELPQKGGFIMKTSLSKRGKGNGLFASERDPFSAMREEFDHMLSRFTGWDWRHAPAVFSPSLDLNETPTAYEVKLDLPGINPADINIQLVDNVLTISGERHEEKTEGTEGSTDHRIERYHGRFSRSLLLPGTVMSDKVDAQYKDGVLHITMPKAAEARPHKITITT
jgi:HSP20 family protein